MGATNSTIKPSMLDIYLEADELQSMWKQSSGIWENYTLYFQIYIYTYIYVQNKIHMCIHIDTRHVCIYTHVHICVYVHV